jgi:hypothetical protein
MTSVHSSTCSFDPRFGADVLHRSAVKAGAHEATLRRSQDFVPAVIAKLCVGAAH